MKSISKNETETDLYESSDTDVKYEETNTDEINETIARAGNKRVRGIWNLSDAGRSFRKRTLNDKFADVVERIIAFIKNTLDKMRVFIYNLYCKHKQYHERVKTVKKSDNTKSKNIKSDSKYQYKGWLFNPKNWNWHVIMGLGRLLAVASMIFSAIVIYMGTGEDIVPKVMIVPMAIFALYILQKQFTASSKGDK